MPHENSSPPERNLFDMLGTTVQEQAVKKLKGSSFGRKLVTRFLKKYHEDSSQLLDDPELVQIGVWMIISETDPEAKKYALVTIYNDMRILLALISEAQKDRRPPKTFAESKIEEVIGKIIEEAGKLGEIPSIKEDIERIGIMVRQDFAARLNYKLPEKRTQSR